MYATDEGWGVSIQNNASVVIGAVEEERERCRQIVLSFKNHKGQSVPYARSIAEAIGSGLTVEQLKSERKAT